MHHVPAMKRGGSIMLCGGHSSLVIKFRLCYFSESCEKKVALVVETYDW